MAKHKKNRSESRGVDGLTILERNFVEAITGPCLNNATAAAERAGYTGKNYNVLKVTAHQVLHKPHIQDAIQNVLAKKYASPEWAKNELLATVGIKLGHYYKNGRFDWEAAAAAGALGQIRDVDKDGQPRGHDRVKALGLLLKVHGLLSDPEAPEESREIKIRRIKRDGNADNP